MQAFFLFFQPLAGQRHLIEETLSETSAFNQNQQKNPPIMLWLAPWDIH
jgi:hypothetical protein